MRLIKWYYFGVWGFPGGSVVKHPPANAGDAGDVCSPLVGKLPGVGNPLQYSSLENSMDRGACWDTVHGVVNSRTWLSTHTHILVSKTFIFISVLRFPREAMAPHSSTLAWKIPWAEEPGRLQSMGSRRVRRDWATSLSLFTFMHWRRKWQPTLVFLPGESQGRGSLVGYRLWGRTESDTTEAT